MASTAPIHVLIFSGTAPGSYRHDCIPAGIAGFWRLLTASPHHFTITASEDPAIFTPAILSRYHVVVLFQVAGAFLTEPSQIAALQAFVRRDGCGLVGVHCAAAGFPGEEWYADLIGGEFAEHPDPQPGVVHIVDPAHPVIAESLGLDQGKGLQQMGEGDGKKPGWQWSLLDEWYNFTTNPRDIGGDRMHVLLTADESSYEGGKHGADHPIAWVQKFPDVDGGRGGKTFYTALGHFDEAYEDDVFMAQLHSGILWAAGRI